MTILDDTYCIYCQQEYWRPTKLQSHVLSQHKDTYAYWSILRAKKYWLEKQHLPKEVT